MDAFVNGNEATITEVQYKKQKIIIVLDNILANIVCLKSKKYQLFNSVTPNVLWDDKMIVTHVWKK